MRDTRRVKTVFNLKYGVAPEELQQLISELRKTIAETPQVTKPIMVLLEGFGENTFQLAVSYYLPHPLSNGAKLDPIKQEVNFKAYSVISKYTIIAPATDDASKPDPCEEEEEQDEKKDETGLGL